MRGSGNLSGDFVHSMSNASTRGEAFTTMSVSRSNSTCPCIGVTLYLRAGKTRKPGALEVNNSTHKHTHTRAHTHARAAHNTTTTTTIATPPTHQSTHTRAHTRAHTHTQAFR